MRPLTLAMTGFRSYTAATVIDFTAKSSVAVIGDTGAGKSSILEAITYALYGRCSWNAVVQPLLADGAKAMQVDLTFTHDGQRWLASRTLRKGATTLVSSHRLENLDTKQRWDNAGPVNEKIKELLCMDHGTFESVVLLPQGRFGKLLEATDSVRTAMLQDLFGARDLVAIRDLAETRARAIATLLADARESRARLHPDPAAAAAEAAGLAASARQKADLLGDALTAMAGLQTQARQAASARAAAATAAEELTRAAVTDAGQTLAALDPVAADCERKAAAAAATLAEAQHRDTELDRMIQSAVEAAAPIHELRSAAATLPDLPGLLEAAVELEASNGEERTRLAAQHAAIERDAAELEGRRIAAQNAEGEARAAVTAATNFRAKADGVAHYITSALGAAENAAQAAADRLTATEFHSSCIEKLPPLQAEAEQAQRALDEANRTLDDLRTQATAADIAAHLHGGDDCPVCQQELPADYRAPHTDADTITQAKARCAKAAAAAKTADTKLLKATTEADKAAEAIDDREADLVRTREAIGAAVDAALTAYTDLTATLPAHATVALEDPETFRAALQHAVDTIAADAEHDSHHVQEAEPRLRAGLRTAAEAITARGHGLTTQAATTRTAIQAAETELSGRGTAHDRETAALTKQIKRHTTAVKSFNDKVGTLPAYVRALLPEHSAQFTTEAIEAAQADVADRLHELDRLEQEKRTVSHQIEQQRQAQQTARDQANTRVQEPLRQLQRRLEAWAHTVRRIAAASTAGIELSLLDPGAQPPTMDTAARYADAVTAAATDLATHLKQQAGAAEADEHRIGTEFTAAAKALAAETGVDITADPSAADALHPLIAAEHGARTDAGRHQEEHDRAKTQIQQAGDLDYAIVAGTARHDAMDELRRQLSNSKFLAYLISRRTEALLRIASHTLGQLTDDQFGFATDFEIVSRNSGVVHGPERLSGGEKFLASLALALALVELHARGGPRLGALFLDEGFAALDAGALDTALEVLREQAGGDRLVMAVSHLHAVAEAVQDVLWVERRTAGSVARWMTDDERDALAERHGDPGLL